MAFEEKLLCKGKEEAKDTSYISYLRCLTDGGSSCKDNGDCSLGLREKSKVPFGYYKWRCTEAVSWTAKGSSWMYENGLTLIDKTVIKFCESFL